MKLTKEKLNSLRVTLQAYLPDNYINSRISSAGIKPEDLEIADVVWLELFSGDLLPKDLFNIVKRIKNIVGVFEPEYTASCDCYLDAYIEGLKTKKYLTWSYIELSRLALKYQDCKKILEEIL